MKISRLILICFLLATISVQILSAQTSPAQKRPKICVVLSGGGARGIAHIGVLQWFEENKIPVDCIAGTSMGGIVGGMYAAGKTPDEMRKIIGEIDWNDVLRATPNYEELSFRRKQDRRQIQSLIEFGNKNGISIPSGFNSGHKVGLIFDRLTLPVSEIKNFDDLVVPFRAVATDMIKGEPVIMKSGSLSSAMRATMAIPGVFTPVEREGKLLADGGLVNNIPTNIAKEMGADIIIAVDIGTPLGDRKSLESIGGILSQSIGIALIGNDRRNLSLADIIIAPDLQSYTLFDFQAAEKIYQLGYEGTQAKALVLKNLALDDAAWTEYNRQKDAQRKTGIPVPEAIAVTGENYKPAQERDIRQRTEEFKGKPLEPEKLEKTLNEIRGEGRLENLGYGIEKINRENTLVIKTAERSNGPTFLTPDVVIEFGGTDEVYTTLGGRFTFFDLGGYRSELRADLKAGSEIVVAGEFYKPIGTSGLFIAPRAYYESRLRNVFENENRIADYRLRRVGVGFDTGYTFRKSEWRAGFDISRISAVPRVGNPALINYKGVEKRAFARYEFDGTDSAFIPTKGFRFKGEAKHFFTSPGANKAFSQAEAQVSVFNTFGTKGVFFFDNSAGTTFNGTSSPFETFQLGGAGRLSAFRRNEFAGNHYFLSRAGYLREVYTLPSLLGGKVYLFGAVEAGGAFNKFNTSNIFTDINGGAVIVTSLGPVTIGASVGERGRRKIYFSLGRFF